MLLFKKIQFFSYDSHFSAMSTLEVSIQLFFFPFLFSIFHCFTVCPNVDTAVTGCCYQSLFLFIYSSSLRIALFIQSLMLASPLLTPFLVT